MMEKKKEKKRRERSTPVSSLPRHPILFPPVQFTILDQMGIYYLYLSIPSRPPLIPSLFRVVPTTVLLHEFS